MIFRMCNGQFQKIKGGFQSYENKKLVSLFLAVAMIFSVFTVSVSADDRYMTANGYHASQALKADYPAWAYLMFSESSYSISAGAEVTNNTQTSKYLAIQAQCVVNYTDGTYNFDSDKNDRVVSAGDSLFVMVELIPSRTKTIYNFIGEYHMGDVNSNELWWAATDFSYYLGINA